ncbi:sulfite exporter TauE/SafE family protein [Leptothoe spongobia]|uniref:Probable membrane transporter protein n=1 Tax=Leptothoe spongobia TAU-MAC 1115 TaxID=1967444 RepID=A0A947DB66_9CYAN|nr:sulfite exporter TauE/SafE family protein [Leptothoe spongobia]MBT9314060.1 sulfite exporter TauE/SafE family protein [Leptothoe spongobia TAU-MAC 1115]
MIYIIAGIVNGLVTGFTGANGMAVVLSILLLAGVNVHSVIGLCLSIQVFTMAATLIPLVQQVGLAMELIPVICIPAMVASYGGAKVSLQMPERFLEVLAVVLLLIVGVSLLKSKSSTSRTNSTAKPSQLNSQIFAKIGFTGAASGFMAGLVGGGGNIIVATALNRMLGVAFRRAMALSLCLGISAAAMGVIPYLQSGQIDLWAAGKMLIPGILSAGLSSHWSRQVPINRIRRMQGLYLLGIATLLTIRSLH